MWYTTHTPYEYARTNILIHTHKAGHALSPQLWINEGAMAVFFFVVGLEIKQELRQGSLSSVRKVHTHACTHVRTYRYMHIHTHTHTHQALLPCIAAAGHDYAHGRIPVHHRNPTPSFTHTRTHTHMETRLMCHTAFAEKNSLPFLSK